MRVRWCAVVAGVLRAYCRIGAWAGAAVRLGAVVAVPVLLDPLLVGLIASQVPEGLAVLFAFGQRPALVAVARLTALLRYGVIPALVVVERLLLERLVLALLLFLMDKVLIACRFVLRVRGVATYSDSPPACKVK